MSDSTRPMSGRSLKVIPDRYSQIGEVTLALQDAGLESSNLIFGVDFTLSNVIHGEKTFNGRSLHHMGEGILNPFQKVISILGETLANFDEDGLIPAFGFGDSKTTDKAVFNLNDGRGYCKGFQDVLKCYKKQAPEVELSGPTNFAPLINKAIEIVENCGRQYHILVIIADGQVTCKAETIKAIVAATKFPLSIIMVGVGDGPWDMMKEFDDELPARDFDNFQFVDFNKVLEAAGNKEATFALHALMEIPDQYSAIKERNLIGRE